MAELLDYETKVVVKHVLGRLLSQCHRSNAVRVHSMVCVFAIADVVNYDETLHDGNGVHELEKRE